MIEVHRFWLTVTTSSDRAVGPYVTKQVLRALEAYAAHYPEITVLSHDRHELPATSEDQLIWTTGIQISAPKQLGAMLAVETAVGQVFEAEIPGVDGIEVCAISAGATDGSVQDGPASLAALAPEG